MISLLVQTAILAVRMLVLPVDDVAQGTSSDITTVITVVNCAGDEQAPTVLVSKIGLEPIPLHTDVQPLKRGVYRLIASVAPGDYFVHLVGHVKYCRADRQLVLLPGHTRHVLLIMDKSIVVTENSTSIAGSLPTEGLTVRVVSENGKEYPAEVDGDAYYLDALRRGKYCLRVGLGYGYLVDLPIDLKVQFTLRNITLEDIVSGAYVGAPRSCSKL